MSPRALLIFPNVLRKALKPAISTHENVLVRYLGNPLMGAVSIGD